MPTDDQWITTRITEARTCHPLVTEAVSSRIAEVLKVQLSGQQLSQRDLTSIAEELIAEMHPTPPEYEVNR